MSSKRHLRRKACDGKLRFESSAAAQRSRRHVRETSGGVVDVYKCRFCKGYHVGHAPAFVQKALR